MAGEVMDWVQLANVPVVSSPDQIFRAHPAVLSKNRVWTRSPVKLGLNHTSVSARCCTNQIAQVNCVYVITNSQLANILAAKQTLLVADNVINTYNLLTAICKLAPVYIVKVSRPYFSTRPQGVREKFGV